jgi:hypothetical protein
LRVANESYPPEKASTVKLSVPSFIIDTVDYIGLLMPTTKSILATLSARGQALTGVTQMEASNSAAVSDVPVFTEANTCIADGKVSALEIPHVLLNLTKSKVHIPLTLLTLLSLCKIHEDPACIKMKKGLVMNNPKLFIMDTSSGFPPELSLQPHFFHEVALNFIKLLSQVADDATVQCFMDHCDFCLSRDEFSDNFESVLTFYIEICRRFFNKHTFLS